MPKKCVYSFGQGKAEGSGKMKSRLGGKGADLAEMCHLGLPVPPGFTITTQVCQSYLLNNHKYPKGLEQQIRTHLKKLEKITGKQFGNKKNALLLSVRSGAAVSMPGMMDTILNLGLNDDVVQGLIFLTNNPRFAWDSYRRFIQMFGNVANGVPSEVFEHELEEVKRKLAKGQGLAGANSLVQEELNREVPDMALGVEELKDLVVRFKKKYKKYTRKDFPQDPYAQLQDSINAVFNSWNNERAIAYREIRNIKGLVGTAVNVQSMVFGNLGEDSGTGVGFTRNPATGENKLYGEYLMNAQGEDVVAGIRTPIAIRNLKKNNKKIYGELLSIRSKIERHLKDMQDFEFTIENGKLYMLQTRTGKRTAHAAVKIAVDMVKEKLINKKTAVTRIEPQQIDQLLHPRFDSHEEQKAKVLSRTGFPASPGAAVGRVVFTAEDAQQWNKDGKEVILCRLETSPEDIRGMHAAAGILTARGGMTSHAAVVARGMGKCCVTGAGDIIIDEKNKKMKSGKTIIREGDWISLNGSKGVVYHEQIKLIPVKISGPFLTVMKWADEMRRLGVRTNADTPHDTEVAVGFGAEGIGLCRTEHMFFEGNRITSFRKMILAAPLVKQIRDALQEEKDSQRQEELKKQLQEPLKQYNQALDTLLPLQRKDFEGIFKTLKGKPCTIRLLDPPLHEFLPADEKGQKETAKAMGVGFKKVQETVESLKESNPMLGHRGCRLGITYPEITKMQARAIIEAAFNVHKQRIKVDPEIMVPLIGHVKELKLQKDVILDAIQEILHGRKMKRLPFSVRIGTMIEIPRATVTADEIAREAEFFSFGTNDLTQMSCGFSRDDAGIFLNEYVTQGIYERDPFQSLDTSGVGKLIKLTVDLARKTHKNIELGICGEHGGDPASIKFCDEVGLDYVSCSPYRVPIARLAGAQAAMKK